MSTSEPSNQEIGELRKTILDLKATLGNASAPKRRRSSQGATDIHMGTEEAEARMEEAIDKINTSPLHQEYPPVPFGTNGPAIMGPMRRLYREIKRVKAAGDMKDTEKLEKFTEELVAACNKEAERIDKTSEPGAIHPK